MNKRLFTCMMLLAACIMTATAQKSEPTTENYLKAVELMDSSEYEAARPLLEAELKKRPKDGYVWEKMASYYLSQYELDSVPMCLDKALLYLPKKDTEKRCEAYTVRGLTHYFTEHPDESLADLGEAQMLKPENEDTYFLRAQILKGQEKHAESDAELRKLLNVYGVDKSGVYYALGKNMVDRGDYSQALKQLDMAYELNQTLTDILIARSDAHLGLGQIREAIDDAVSACKLEYVEDTFNQMNYLASDENNRASVIARAKQELETTDQPGFWYIVLHSIYNNAGNKPEALRYLLRAEKQGEPSANLSKAIADIFSEAEMNDIALAFVNRTMQAEDVDEDDLPDLRYYRANLLYSMGKTQESIDSITALCNEYGRLATLDKSIANKYFFTKQPKEAIRHMTAIDDEDEKDADYWQMLIRMYQMDGDDAGVAMATEKAMQTATNTGETASTCALNSDYASTLKALRQAAEEAKAIESEDDETAVAVEKTALTDEEVDSIMAQQLGPYNMACIYSLIGEKQKAIGFLTQALKDGWKDFMHIERDTDLDNIRGEADFISVVKMYQSIAKREQEELKDIYETEFLK